MGEALSPFPLFGTPEQMDQPRPVIDRQQPHQQPIHYAEDGGVRPNAERQGQRDHNGEAGPLPQHSRAVAQVLPDCLHNSSKGYWYADLTDRYGSARMIRENP